VILSQNICFFNTTPFWGGGEKWHFETALMCSQTRHKTFFVAHKNGALAKKLEPHNIQQMHISVNNRSFLNPLKINQLTTFFTKNQINTVVFNSPKDLKIGGKAAKRAGVKNIVYRRGIAVEVKKTPLNKKLFKEFVTHFVFNSKATKLLLEKNFKSIIETKKTATIYNAIEFKKNKIDRRLNTKIVIGNAGRLVEQKGQHFLIDIAEKLKKRQLDFKILIAGDGPLYDKLLQKIKEKNLSKQIELMGFVKDMDSFMSGIDIFVSTALWEGFGFVLAEAMAKEKPVLAFDLSSNPELIKHSENGFLIEPKNTTEFSKRIEELIINVELRNQMGKNAFQFAKNNFEKQQQFQKLMEFIAN